MKVALVAGSTGLIGSQLLQLLLDDPYYAEVKAISRKPLSIKHPKLNTIIMNADELANHSDNLKADDVFCCLGTTIRKAGSQEAFRAIDYDYPLELARISKAQGAEKFLLITALGANKNSSVFYNRVKGEVEDTIGELNYPYYHIFRPSLLMGPRNETRAGEEAAKTFFKYFGFLVPLKYKGIDSMKVAKAMLYFAKQNQSGKFIHESNELQKY